MKKRLFQILETTPHDDSVSRGYDSFMLTVIILNVIFLCLETVQEIHQHWHSLFFAFEWFSIALFTFEYLLRLWVCTENPIYKAPILGRIRYIASFFAIVDLLSFLPFYIFLYSENAKYMAVIRVFRLIRIIKLAEYSNALIFLGRVIQKRKEELLTTGFLTFILLICASSVMYILEHEAQPDKFSSIPMAMWWGVTALTTVGYGDVFPITPIGKIFACIVAVLGIGVFALPAGILGASFLEEVQASKFEQLEDLICKHCGNTVTLNIRRGHKEIS